MSWCAAQKWLEEPQRDSKKFSSLFAPFARSISMFRRFLNPKTWKSDFWPNRKRRGSSNRKIWIWGSQEHPLICCNLRFQAKSSNPKKVIGLFVKNSCSLQKRDFSHQRQVMAVLTAQPDRKHHCASFEPLRRVFGPFLIKLQKVQKSHNFRAELHFGIFRRISMTHM